MRITVISNWHYPQPSVAAKMEPMEKAQHEGPDLSEVHQERKLVMKVGFIGISS
jgi:hypothetical protein